MSAVVARRQAEQLIRRFNITAPSVKVERIVADLGLRLVRKPLGAVSGLLILGADAATICVNNRHPANRQRFTIAHEIGHHYLKHQLRPGEHVFVDEGHFISQRGARASEGVDPIEIEANQFAAALLMPADFVRDAVSELGVTMLLDTHVADLAEKFEVSEQAMTIRLSALRYL